ncbi:transposase [Desulforamulus hydrothermalis]|nr:transposase [Desulforamulus hydrothermalis]
MPRTGRKKSKSGIYHIVLRGINKQLIFEEEEDSHKFLQTLGEYKKISGFKIYAYCLMDNHVHLLIKEEVEELGLIMRRIGASYVYWYNRKYERCGHLFQDRYKSEAVEDGKYFLTVLRYIHQNPLKAGLVKEISQYKWSSYAEYVSESKIVDTELALKIFGDNREKALNNFIAFHKTENKDSCLDIAYINLIKDSEAAEIIKLTCRVNHCHELQRMDRCKRDRFLRILREKGLSTRQIARLTGISRAIILKA